MIYKVVIIDNKGDEVILTEKNGIRSIDGVGDVDLNIMDEALDNLKKAVIEDER